MNKLYKTLLIIHSLKINLEIFDLKTAVKVPVFFSFHVKTKGLYKGCIEIDERYMRRGIVTIGVMEGVFGGFKSNKSFLQFQHGGKIIFKGQANFATGLTIRVLQGGIIEIGNNMTANPNMSLLCKKHIRIGEDSLVGWDVTIRDTDGHDIYDINSNELLNEDKTTMIGNHVWIGAGTQIFKGVCVGDNSIIGGRSIVTRNIKENSLVAGTPAKIIKENVYWKA